MTVTVTKTPQPFVIDPKRFRIPGHVLESKCPACGKARSSDLAVDCLTRPEANGSATPTGFYCDDCARWWWVNVYVTVDVSAEPVHEVVAESCQSVGCMPCDACDQVLKTVRGVSNDLGESD